MRSIRKDLITILAFGLVAGLIYLLNQGSNQGFLTKAIGYASTLIAIGYGIISLKYFGRNTSQGKIVLNVLLGLGLWLVGDVAWHFSATANLAEIAYFLGYLFFSIGIIKGITVVEPDFFKKRALIVTVLFIVCVIVYLKFFPLTWDSSLGFWENAGTVGYLLVDLVLLVLVAIILILLMTGSYSHAWLAMCLAIVSSFVSDVVYAINYETYASGDLVDLGWIFGYLLYAAFFVLLKYNAERAMESAKIAMPEKKAKKKR